MAQEPLSFDRKYLLGGLMLLFGLGLGWWLKGRQASSPAGSRLLAAGHSASLPPFSSKEAALGPEQSFNLESFEVGATAREIVSGSVGRARRVRIATDQPLRVSNTSEVTQNPQRGLPIMPGEQPYDLGVIPAGTRLFAVIPAGGQSANVSISTQLVGG